MEYKAGDKFEIEIEETADCNCEPWRLYKIKGFNSLVFDQKGLDQLAKIDPKQTEGIKIGDSVEVIDCGLWYSRYTEWIEKECPQLIDRFKSGGKVYNGEIGIVMTKAPHLVFDRMLYAVLINGKIRIMGEKGIEKVEDKL